MAITYSEEPLTYTKHNFEDDAVLHAQDLRDIDDGIYDTVERVNSQGEVLEAAVSDLSDLRTTATQRLTEHSNLLSDYTDIFTGWEEEIGLYLDGSSTAGTNANRYLTPGSYYVNGGYVGTPLETANDTGYIFVFGFVDSETPENTTLCQICVEGHGSNNIGALYTRHYFEGEWSDWRKTYLETDVTADITELQTQYSGLLARVVALEGA